MLSEPGAPAGSFLLSVELKSPLPKRNGAAGSPAPWRGAKRGQAAAGGRGGRAAACCDELLEKILPWGGSGGCWPRPRGPWVSCTRPALRAGALLCVFPRPWAVTHGVWGKSPRPVRCWTRRQVCFSRDRGGFQPEKNKKQKTSSVLFRGSGEAINVCSSRWLLLDFKPSGAARQQLPQARPLPFYGRGSLRRGTWLFLHPGRGTGNWQQPQDPTTPDVALQAPS